MGKRTLLISTQNDIMIMESFFIIAFDNLSVDYLSRN